jgi:hypothetical protein
VKGEKMAAQEEMELDLKLGEEKMKTARLSQENYALRKKVDEVKTILQKMITDPQVTVRAKMIAADALDKLHD